MVSFALKGKIGKERGAAVRTPLSADMSKARRECPDNRVDRRTSGDKFEEATDQTPSLDTRSHLPLSPYPPNEDPEGIGTWTPHPSTVPLRSVFPLDMDIDDAKHRLPETTTTRDLTGYGPTPSLPTCPRNRSSLPHSPISWASQLLAGAEGTSATDITALMLEAAESVRNDFNEDSALEWAHGYAFPAQYLESDASCLRAAQLDFVAMVRRRLKILSPNRLNRQRVSRLRPDNPEIPLLYELVIGMHVPLPEGFTPNGQHAPSPLRATYVNVAPAVNKMLGDVVQQRLAFLLPYEDAKRYVPNLHLCKAHWTRKKGKPSGRPLGDLTYVDGTPVNTPAMSEAAAAHYGAILHPTIEDIANMICQFWLRTLAKDPTADWTLLRIWKMDLKGAYTLLSFRPEDVGLFAMMLTGDIVYLQIAGIFGWAGTPAAFQVVTRAIQWELRHRLQSSTIMYVDDIIGVCMLCDLEGDLVLTRDTCTDLLGPTSVADDKTETGRRLDVIGYVIDLDIQRVLIARKNYLNALHGFASVDLNGVMNLRTAQKLASWGSRYGKICRVMRPFCGALNRMIAGRLDPHATFPLSDEARIAVQCWQAMLCLVRFQESRFTRTIESFAPITPTSVGEFDASLTGAGLIWYERSLSTEVTRGVCAVDLTSLGFLSDSSYQNLSEFIGAILAVLGHIALGNAGRSIALRGDSVTALTWAMTERPRGSIATNAAMIWTLLCVAADVHVTHTTHIPGSDNDRCDQLSRRGPTPTTTIIQHAINLGLGLTPDIGLGSDVDVCDMIELCRPSLGAKTDVEFTHFWNRARRSIDSFVARHEPLIPPTSMFSPTKPYPVTATETDTSPTPSLTFRHV